MRLASSQKTASQIKEEHPVISTDSDLTIERENYWPEGHPSSMTELDALFKHIQRLNGPAASGRSESTSPVRTPQPGSPEVRVRPHAVSRVVSSEIDDASGQRTRSSSVGASLHHPAHLTRSPMIRPTDPPMRISDAPPSAYRGRRPFDAIVQPSLAYRRAAEALLLRSRTFMWATSLFACAYSVSQGPQVTRRLGSTVESTPKPHPSCSTSRDGLS